jgi:hypothetical protein
MFTKCTASLSQEISSWGMVLTTSPPSLQLGLMFKTGRALLLSPSVPSWHIINSTLCYWGSGSSVSIATDYGLDSLGNESQWGRDCLHKPRPTLGTTQPPVQWVPGFSQGQSDWGVVLTTHPVLVPRLRMGSYISTSPSRP